MFQNSVPKFENNSFRILTHITDWFFENVDEIKNKIFTHTLPVKNGRALFYFP